MNVYFERKLESVRSTAFVSFGTPAYSARKRISFNFDYGHICIAISSELQALSNYREWSTPIFLRFSMDFSLLLALSLPRNSLAS